MKSLALWNGHSSVGDRETNIYIYNVSDGEFSIAKEKNKKR